MIQVSPLELKKIGEQIRRDYDSASMEHTSRMERWDLAYRKLMRLINQVSAENKAKNNLEVPMMLWTLLDHIAQEHQSIFGMEAHIEADPTGDADVQSAQVVGAGMHWLVYKAICLKRKWGRFSFYRAFFGRAFAYRPYVKRYAKFGGTDPLTGQQQIKDVVVQNSPEFEAVWPDDIIVPAEDVKHHDEFSFMIHRRFLTLNELLEQERSGKMFGITDNFERIRGCCKTRSHRSTGGQQMKQSREQAEGVDPSSLNDRSGRVEIWYWYSTWRFPLMGPDGEIMDANIHDRDARGDDAEEIVCAFIPECSLEVGLDNLIEMYPEMEHRRPFWSSAMNDALGYWGPGYADMLFPLQAEATENHRIFSESGKRNAIATVFMRPLNAMNPDRSMTLDPTKIHFTQDPAQVQAIRLGGDTNWCIENDQKVMAMAERLTGRSDLNSGRMIDRANAPKTATQTMALLEAGNVRTAYNASNIAEDLSVLFADYWRMWTYFGGPRLIFRITEKDLPPSMYASIRDANEIEQAARNMSFDFKIQFAPSEFRRASMRQDALTLLGLALKNPVVAQSPRAIWNLTRRVHELHGDREFPRLVPQPAEIDTPVSPVEEWVRMQQGEEVFVSPLDPDEQHIADHQKRILEEAQAPDPDLNLIAKAKTHLEAHMKQLAMKRMMEAAMGQAQQAAQGMLMGATEEQPEGAMQ